MDDEDSVFHLLDRLDQTREISRSQPSQRLRARRPQAERARYDDEQTLDQYNEHRKLDFPYGRDDVALGQDIPFDAFDKELLRRPYEDRQRQAERGQARLSFAPKASRYFNDGTLQDRYGRMELEGDPIELPVGNQPERIQDLSRFSYQPTHVHEPSCELQGLSSSPAFKASQRHNQSHHPASKHQQKHPSEYDDGLTRRERPPPPRGFGPSSSSEAQRGAPLPIQLKHAPLMAQGIQLVSVAALPDRLRTIFPFPLFNAVQSRCFERVFRSDDNFVLSSPTGSGKTAILELAICRTINNRVAGQYKIVYQAPTKALCSERQRDWQKKFGPLGLQCEELTGDSDSAHLRNIQSASIIITTPEKWDSITRKWKDHERLMHLVKLFLIDEVHILKDDRGATLEAVVSRMKSVGTDVRFVALSATVPNLQDVATWLGKSPMQQSVPAEHERFGEEFRPVKLKKHVCGYQSNVNDFAFEKLLDSKLPEVIAKHSARKPIMVFCFTRNSTVNTAKLLTNWWSTKEPRDRYWKTPSRVYSFADTELRNCASSGVAFHHAGMDQNDRLAVEDAYLKGELSVICSTSTLAVGINLPCHFVIIKNTVYWSPTGVKEYSDSEIMQMLGRAGRPQFDDSAVAVIMTRQHKVRNYEAMVSGQELVESHLHLNLIDHLNAEVGLGTIDDMASAKKWLAGTFLYVRLKQNPTHYKLEGSRSEQNIDEQLDDICNRDITLLKQSYLVSDTDVFKSTRFGDIMARYYVEFTTMKLFMGLSEKPRISDILSALAQASEFKEVRFRAGEKAFYKDLNKSPYIRFPIPVNLDLPAHKASLIIQSVLGMADLNWNEHDAKHRPQYNTEVTVIFRHINRLIRCIIDCQIHLEDSVGILNALMLERSLGSRAWDDGPMQMRQIEQLGMVTVRKLVNVGIKSLEDLENTESHRIEAVLSKNPPFGMRLLDRLKSFPKLRVAVHLVPKSIVKCDEGVKVRVKAEMGFLNERPVVKYRNTLVYVCIMAETSDGRMAHFARTSGQKIGNGLDLIFQALLTEPSQCINCYVMCDEMAGTLRKATVDPKVPANMFPPLKPQEVSSQRDPERPTSNMSRRRAENGPMGRQTAGSDDFGDDDLDDADLVQASIRDLNFAHIDNFGDPNDSATRKNTAKNSAPAKRKGGGPINDTAEDEEDGPRQLPNGKWACNHRCKDKSECKHMCCREGLDKPRKRQAKKPATSQQESSMPRNAKQGPSKAGKEDKTQTRLQLPISKKRSSVANIEVLDLTQQEKRKRDEYSRSGPRDFRSLHQLHNSVLKKKEPPSSISSVKHKKPVYSYAEGGEPSLSFLGGGGNEKDIWEVPSSNYGDLDFGDPCSPLEALENSQSNLENVPAETDDAMDVNDPTAGDADETIRYDPLFDDDDSLLDAAMVGLADSEDLQNADNGQAVASGLAEIPHLDEEEPTTTHADSNELSDTSDVFAPDPIELSSSSTMRPSTKPATRNKTLFINTDTSSPGHSHDGFVSARSMLVHEKKLTEMRQVAEKAKNERLASKPSRRPVDEENTHPRDGDRRSDKRLGEETTVGVVVPLGYEDIEPWIIAEFGDYVEFV